MRKRIFHLTKPNSKKSRLLLTFLTVCMVGSACIPVAAYSPVTIDWREGTDFTNSFEENSDWLYFTETEEAIDLPEDEINFKYSDTYVILDTGEIVLVDEHDAALGAARTSCSHNYVSGIAKRHVASADGGCTVYSHQALYCTICQKTQYFTVLSSNYYNKCPH